MEVFSTFAEVLATDIRLIVIDVPIGIMTNEPRQVDRAARELLGERACCVFSSPYKAMLAARSHPEACSIRERIDGKRCSRQAFEITAKIAEVDALMGRELQSRVREGHPEITFAIMQGGIPMPQRKKSAAGRAARLAALRPHFPEIDVVASARRPAGVAADDLLDAYAMLWTALRVDTGIARRLPGVSGIDDQRDDRGVTAEMLA
jgi:predicted RNase H-like nuclease